MSLENANLWSRNFIMTVLLDIFFLQVVISYIQFSFYQKSIGSPLPFDYLVRSILMNSPEADKLFQY
jgi:hypothetical protein